VAVTTEQRLEWLAKARAARTEAKPANVRDDFMDMNYWESLASEFGVQLPKRGQEVTTGKLTKWLKKIGLTPKAYCEWTGSKTFKDAVALARGYGLRPIAAIALEHRDIMLRYGCAESARGEK
jgi:hypothetical protein